jgi:hypothetical protein
VAEWFKATVLKTVISQKGIVSSNLTPTALYMKKHIGDVIVIAPLRNLA